MAERYHLNLICPPGMGTTLHRVSEQSQLSISDLVRRMVDYCVKEPILNEVVPCMSGQFAEVK